MNWRDPATYDYTQTLNAAQWAWEFLRRNSEYQSDYHWFKKTWDTLEQRYGKPPARDYSRWQQDPLAWRISDERLSSQECTMDGERLQIECWMGQKWGFYKFPLDPSHCAPVSADQLAWRERPTDAVMMTHENSDTYLTGDTRIALGFDLSLPLKQQLEDSRKMLAILQRQLQKHTPERICKVATQREYWMTCLRILDGLAIESYTMVNEHFIGEGIDIALLSKNALQLCKGGYLDLLVIPDK